MTISIHSDIRIDNWIRFINENRFVETKSSDRGLTIAFESDLFLKPFMLTTLACLIEEYFQNGFRINIVSNPKFKNSKYLRNIRFDDYWSFEFDRDNFTNVQIETTLCLWHISEPMINSYASSAQGYYERNVFPGMELEQLNLCLVEAFNNIYDHSNSKIDGYVITQYFPSSHKLEFSICDFGVGIARSVNKFLSDSENNELEDSAAIKKAFEKKFTVQSSPRNMGFGLDNLLSIVKVLNGELFVIANEGYVYFKKNKLLEGKRLEGPFSGTVINIVFDTRRFSQKEDEVRDEVFNF